MRWTIHPLDDLERHRDTWQAINAAALDSPVLDPRYVFPLARYLGSGREILAIGSVAGRPRAATLIVSRRPGSWHTFEAGGCPFGAWVCEPDIAIDVALGSLLRTLPGFAIVVGLTRQDPRLVERPKTQGAIRTLDYIETPSIAVAGSFAQFWSARSKSFRQNIRTAINRQTRQGIGDAALVVVTDPDHVVRAVDEHGLLESGTWKVATGNALHPANPQGGFFSEAMRKLACIGDARVYQYRYDNRLVASALCVDRNGTLIVLRTAYDERERFTSPGQVMHHHMLQSIFDRGAFRRVEFYGETMVWERQWTDDTRIMYHVNCYRRPLVARLHGRLSRWWQTVSRAS